MNVTLFKRLPSFTLKLKDTNKNEKPMLLDASGIYLTLKRISSNNENHSLEIPLQNTSVNLPDKVITVKSDYIEPFNIPLSDYEVDQIDVILRNYINLIEEKTTLNDVR